MIDKRREMCFSQAAIAVYQTCPRKFRYRYLDELHWLQAGQRDLRQEERMLGEHFHLLAQRYFQNVELHHLFRLAPPGLLRDWLESLQQRFPLQQDQKYFPEQELRIVLEDVCLTAKYDLLTVNPDGRVFIYDWKTQVSQPGKRVRTLQAQVYSLVLCAAQPFGPMRPEDITMVFWNPRFPKEEQVWQYSELLYRQDRAELTGLIAEIMDRPSNGFPGIKPAEDGPVSQECQRCNYAALCFHQAPAGLHDVPMAEQKNFSWDDIQEIFYEEA